MENLAFLHKIGKRVDALSQLQPGDVVGRCYDIHSESDVRIYMVDRLDLKPYPMSLPPCAVFKPPHVGLVVIDGRVYRHYIHTPMPGESCEYGWTDGQPTDILLKDGRDINYPLWKIVDEKYRSLGELIADMTVPSWGFLAQSTQGDKPIRKFVRSVRRRLAKARRLHDKIYVSAKAVR